MHERIHQDTLALIHTYPHIHTHTNCEQDGQSQEFFGAVTVFMFVLQGNENALQRHYGHYAGGGGGVEEKEFAVFTRRVFLFEHP